MNKDWLRLIFKTPEATGRSKLSELQPNVLTFSGGAATEDLSTNQGWRSQINKL